MTYKWTDTSKQTIKFTDSNNKEFFIPVNEANTDYQEYLAWVSKDSSYFIPFDNGNTDYQEYLEWVSKGNTAEEAD